MRSFRSSFLVSGVVVLAAVLAGCTGGTTKSTTTRSGFQTVQAGVLTVATNLPAPGFWNGDDPVSITGGYEYGMAQEMARRLGLRSVVVRNVSFDALIAGQVKGYDLALSTVNITPERAKVVDFSVPYFSSDQGILVRTGSVVTSDNVRTLRWGVQQASTSEAFVTQQIKPSREPSVYPDFPPMFAALAAGQIDAVLLDTVQVLAEAKESKGTLSVVGQFRTGGVYGAILPKGSPDKPIVDRLIEQMRQDGTLAALSKKWLVPAFGEDPTTIPYLQP